MNWLHFSFYLAGLYTLYYLVVILIDVAGAKRAPAANSLTNELTFSETVKPTQLSASPKEESESADKTRMEKTVDPTHQPEVIGSGGMVIDNLFRQAKQEAIIYTRSVSF